MERTQTTTETSEKDRDVVVSVRNTSVSFGMERGTSNVLNDVDLDIERDEIIGVVGESGSGKSMFASALLDAVVDPGMLSGSITYHPRNGNPVDILSLSDEQLRLFRWEEISMVFQGAMSSFNPVITIEKHFRETLTAHSYEVESGLTYARRLLSDLYLDPDRVLSSYPHELSGGMKQRALIALSLVLEPEVLVMDEPTAALDLLMQRSILNLLKEIQAEYDLTVIFITHDLPLVANLADRLVVMYAFEFVEVGLATQIINNPRHPYTRSLLRAIPNLDAPLSEMRPIEGSAPDPVNVPQGCSYHPRCPLADDTCREVDPSFFAIEDEHEAKCFHWEEAPEAIPLSTKETVEETVIEGKQSDEPLLELENVSVFFERSEGGILNLFDDPQIVRAVDNVSLDVYENDVVALVGESGCGKTTLGETALGIQRPTHGDVRYRGQEIWDARAEHGDVEIPFDDIRRALQIVQQDPGGSLNPNRSIRASLSEPLRRWEPDLDRNDRETRILGFLEHVGMSPPEDYAERYPHQLSGGEQQRVALIRSLLMNPDLILADEAVSALDVSLRVEMMDLMHELQTAFSTSYLFISHDLANARYFAGKVDGRIAVMYLGKIVEIGPAEEVINDPRHPYTKVLLWSTADLTLEEADDPPLRGIDIPDPANPPAGCRFHTRCPEAREVCRGELPELFHENVDGDHGSACFRDYSEDHPYWDSPSIVDEDSKTATVEADD